MCYVNDSYPKSITFDTTQFTRVSQSPFQWIIRWSVPRFHIVYEVDVETRAQFWATRQQAVNEILRRAEARGELRDDVRPTVVMQLVSSPLHTLALYSDRPATHDYCQAIADLVARAVTRA